MALQTATQLWGAPLMMLFPPSSLKGSFVKFHRAASKAELTFRQCLAAFSVLFFPLTASALQALGTKECSHCPFFSHFWCSRSAAFHLSPLCSSPPVSLGKILPLAAFFASLHLSLPIAAPHPTKLPRHLMHCTVATADHPHLLSSVQPPPHQP